MTQVAERPRFRRQDVLCTAGLAVNGACSVVLTFATAYLLAHHVLVLLALSTSPVGLVTAGALARVDRVPLVLVLLVPLLIVITADVFFWWAGRLWGDRVLLIYTERAPRTRRMVERAEAWVRDRGITTLSVCYFLPVPNPAVYVLCGASGMRLRVFLLGDALGTLLWTVLMVGLGWQVGQRGVDLVDTIDRYTLWVTLAIIALVVVIVLVRRSRRSRT